MAWNQDFGEGANPGSGFAQQSWRDSFNGGKAAGDWTGNHNARLDAERAAFGGATWSGSSTQPSAFQLAQSMVGTGPGRGGVASGTGSSGTGPGNPVVSSGPVVPTKGPGRAVVVMGPVAAPPKNKVVKPGTANVGPWDEQFTNPGYQYPRDTLFTGVPTTDQVRGVPFPVGPFNFELSPLVPPAQVIEDNLGEGDVGWPAFFVNWGTAFEHVRWNSERAIRPGMSVVANEFAEFNALRNEEVPVGYFSPGSGW